MILIIRIRSKLYLMNNVLIKKEKKEIGILFINIKYLFIFYFNI